jgi:hypothetical protein
MAISPQDLQKLLTAFQGLPPMQSQGGMTIEPLDPNQGPVMDQTLPPPPPVGMLPLPAPNPNKQIKPIPVNPDIDRPKYTGMLRT